MNLKLILASSIALNLALSGAAIYLSQSRPENPAQGNTPLAAVKATPPPAKHFSWSDIHSDNLMILMDNLHSIGCPDDVILRIVRTDESHPSSASEGRQATSQGSVYSSSSPASGGTTAVQGHGTTRAAASGSLEGSNAATIGRVATSNEPLGSRSAGQTYGEAAGGAVPSSRRAVTPLAWQDGGSGGGATSSPMLGGSPANVSATGGGGVPLNEAQIGGVNNVQDAFVDEMSGTSRNANDPVYARKWTSAQQLADDRLRAMLGDSAFIQYQLNAARGGK